MAQRFLHPNTRPLFAKFNRSLRGDPDEIKYSLSRVTSACWPIFIGHSDGGGTVSASEPSEMWCSMPSAGGGGALTGWLAYGRVVSDKEGQSLWRDRFWWHVRRGHRFRVDEA